MAIKISNDNHQWLWREKMCLQTIGLLTRSQNRAVIKIDNLKLSFLIEGPVQTSSPSRGISITWPSAALLRPERRKRIPSHTYEPVLQTVLHETFVALCHVYHRQTERQAYITCVRSVTLPRNRTDLHKNGREGVCRERGEKRWKWIHRWSSIIGFSHWMDGGCSLWVDGGWLLDEHVVFSFDNAHLAPACLSATLVLRLCVFVCFLLVFHPDSFTTSQSSGFSRGNRPATSLCSSQAKWLHINQLPPSPSSFSPSFCDRVRAGGSACPCSILSEPQWLYWLISICT